MNYVICYKGKSQDQHNANPHNLLISESNELLDGLKNLYDKSDDNERVRLMTIASKQWGRKKSKNGELSSLIIFDH